MTTEVVQAAVESPSPMVAMMERLALNPDLPVDKLRELLDMQMLIRAREAEQAFAESMALVQAELPIVLKDAYNDQTRSPYATLSAISEAIRPIYTRHGFSLSFSEAETPKPDHIRIRAVVRHRGGHRDETPFVDVAVDQKGIKGNENKTLTHAEGSSFTYGRRYLTCMIFDIATGVDTDGNSPGETITAEQAEEIKKRLIAMDKSPAAFLNWLGAATFEAIPVRDLKRATEQLDRIERAGKK